MNENQSKRNNKKKIIGINNVDAIKKKTEQESIMQTPHKKHRNQ